MKKKIIISLICLIAVTGFTAYCFTNNDTDVSKHTIHVTKQEVKSSKKETKSKKKKDEDNTSVASVNTQQVTNDEVKTESSTTTQDKTSVTKKSEKAESNNVSTNQSNTSTSKQETVEQTKPQETVQESVIESTPIQTEPSYACPGGVNQNLACDAIIDSNFYYATFSSEGEANSSGEYYLNSVMYIGETEITNYSVQPVYRNDHNIAYYGLNLWSNGQLIY